MNPETDAVPQKMSFVQGGIHFCLGVSGEGCSLPSGSHMKLLLFWEGFPEAGADSAMLTM